MIRAKNRYFSLNRIFLLMLGLWPYEQSKLVWLQLILHSGILGSFIIFQFTTFATSKCDLQLVIEILSITSFFFNFVIVYLSFCFNMDVVKHLLELLQHTYDELKDEDEIAIIENYWNIAKRYTEVLTRKIISHFLLWKNIWILLNFNYYFSYYSLVLIVLCVSFFIFSPFLPYIFDVVFSTNESWPHPSLQIVTEYFIDEDRYFYLIILHADTAFFIGALAMLGTGTFLIMYIQHVCGMLKIASYRIERVMTISIQRMSGVRNTNLIHKSIICAIDMHRKALKLVSIEHILHMIHRNIKNLYQVMYQEILSGCISEKLIQSVLIMNMYYTYTFLANHMAQQVMDHNNNVFATVYNIQWYTAPLQVQKVILFLLQRGSKTLKIMIGGMFMGSLEGFATVKII
ncbi:uncharacterized protein LOC105426735 [Pogonomyrmex barbatus]|uniref:Odorant receptor n=1 Tax=Pogonomyrmex barbatus TaxID=144034 RepID=A0A6I9W7S7_9HYME|nr:uncharacterized protein LOC105426735 [Pogonomyrmex barbatus]